MSLVSNRYGISTATVLLLIVLRLNIGWHFFSEGVHHFTDPKWTSEPVLRAAKGPLAPMYKKYLPDFHGLEQWLHGDKPEESSHAVKGWIDEIQKDWDDDRQQFSVHYGLNEAQQKQATRVLKDYQAEVRSWAAANKDALENHVHQWQRKEEKREQPSSEAVPYQKARIAESQATLAGEAAGWKKELTAIQADYEQALTGLLTAEQRSEAPLPPPANPLARVDGVMKYAITVIGLLLMLGLFTRSAALAGALFLLSVVLTQPFWVSESAPTFNQNVEMFALLMLATTAVGRWAGLDYFVHNLLYGTRESTPERTPVLATSQPKAS